MNIALLEDNPAVLDYMSTALRMAGHNVSTHVESSSLLAALFHPAGVCSPLPYDLVIVDLLLPGDMSGVEAIHRIRQSIPPDTLPIVIVSACSQYELAQVKARFPHIPMLRKPFKMSKLLQTINQLKPV
ncbi:MAG TPA: response regulator [Ktedonobacteraceae bacterium]|jgi:DNA-binding response OmpR family regulator|nr:response regulator [Ktedonobacteraceae bacterium]